MMHSLTHLSRFSPLQFSYIRMWREVASYASRRQKLIILAYHFVYLVAIGFNLLQPYLLGKLVNVLQAGGADVFQESLRYISLIIMASMGFWVFHGPARVIERRVAQQIYMHYLTVSYQRVTEMPIKWHQDHHSGQVINRIGTAGSGIKNFVQDGFVSIQNVGTLIGSIGMLIWFNATLGVISACAFVTSLMMIFYVNRFMVRALHAHNEANHAVNATFFDFVSNIGSIIILRLQDFSRLTLRHKLDATMKPWMSDVRINEIRYFIYTIMHVGMMAGIVLGYIYYQVEYIGAIAAGSLVTVYMYQNRIGDQGFSFLSMHAEWLRSLTACAATKDLVEDHARLAPKEEIVLPENWQDVTLHDTVFAHKADDGGARMTLHVDGLSIRHGEKIALIGTSGAGKSTLLSLLRGLHEPVRTQFTIDGQPHDFAALAAMTTLIPQDPEIFENTLKFNVGFGLDVPDDMIISALDRAEFLPVLRQLPMGIETDIREKGVNLSVGQKQRLAMARGIFAAAQSDIVLLDEPTSSLDLPTEERIFRRMFADFADKTIIATLHRLHLLPMFDRIIFLDQGRITADLPARDALSQPGPIRALYAAYQMGNSEKGVE